MSMRNIVLTGIPRSGTTLCCNLLGQAEGTVALFEPMPVHLLPLDAVAALKEISGFFSRSRNSLLAEGVALSQQLDGRVPDNPFGTERDQNGQRVRRAHLGQIQVDKPLTPDFTLVVKHNAAFTALLEHLFPAFECYAVVRNPLAVLASWNSVDLPVARGRLPAGERLDAELSRRLDAEPDLLQRQLLLLDWLFGRFGRVLPADRIIRYEQVVASAGGALAAVTQVAVPALPMRSRNSSQLYDASACQRYAGFLLADTGAWRNFYSEADISSALVDLLDRS